MIKIENLANHDMGSCSILAGVPSDDRLVVVQVNLEGCVKTVGARYVNERWISEEAKFDLTEELLSSYSIWFESPLFLPTSISTDLVPLVKRT